VSDKIDLAHCPNSPKAHWLSFSVGAILFLAFFGLPQTATTLSISIRIPFTWSSSGEVLFWLAHALLLVPGACLIGYGLSPWVSRSLRNAWDRAESVDGNKKFLTMAALAIMLVLIAGLSHRVILSGYPITDDEYATKFGGQVLALGKTMIPMPVPFEPFPKLFLFEREGKITSFDWLGPQLIWAISEITRSGPLIFAILSAITGVCLTLIMARKLSPGYGLVAFSFFLFSPMAFALSATTHAQILSRATIAVTLLCYVRAQKKATRAAWSLTGLSLGLSLCSRPIETAFILGPLFLGLFLKEMANEKRLTIPVQGVLLGILLPMAIFLVHNQMITGHYYFPARFTAEGPGSTLAGGSLWNRFGSNMSYNLLMLAVYFLGPLGVILVIFGAMTDRFTKFLTAGVAALLGVACFHDNQGIHIIGPIHYSECVVPLIIVGTCGLANIKRWLGRRRVSFRIPAACLAGTLVLGLGTFNVWQALALHKEASIQKQIYGFIESSLEKNHVEKAVVIAPQFWVIWESIPEFRNIGTWVREWRKPKPDFSDRTLILFDVPRSEAALRKKFPDRVFFRLDTQERPPFLKLKPIEP
jgi:Dolichyl-phosphate-mannose-protein mannosyltransferase